MIDKIKFNQQIEEIREESDDLKAKILSTMKDWMESENLSVFPINTYPYRSLVLQEDGTLAAEETAGKITPTELLGISIIQPIYGELKEAIAKSISTI